MRVSVKDKIKNLQVKNFDWEAWGSSARVKFGEYNLISLFKDMIDCMPNLGSFSKGKTLYLVDLKKNKVVHQWDLLRVEDILEVSIQLFTMAEKVIYKHCKDWVDGGLDQTYNIGGIEDVFMVRIRSAEYLKLFRREKDLFAHDMPF